MQFSPIDQAAAALAKDLNTLFCGSLLGATLLIYRRHYVKGVLLGGGAPALLFKAYHHNASVAPERIAERLQNAVQQIETCREPATLAQLFDAAWLQEIEKTAYSADIYNPLATISNFSPALDDLEHLKQALTNATLQPDETLQHQRICFLLAVASATGLSWLWMVGSKMHTSGRSFPSC